MMDVLAGLFDFCAFGAVASRGDLVFGTLQICPLGLASGLEDFSQPEKAPESAWSPSCLVASGTCLGVLL